jgi:succinoglycan biosynthesis transport protein ExoP
VISSAAPSSRKSKPIDSLILAIAATMGIILSLGIATLREAIDGVFRTTRQIEQTLRIKCLSVIPLLTKQAVSASGTAHRVARRKHPYANAWRGSNQLTGASETPDATRFAFADPLMRHVVDEPLSVFTEAFRAIKVATEIRAATRNDKVIGITSTVPNEGKSTIACNLAALMADAGRRVILIDTDLRNPTLVRTLTPRPSVGLMELLCGKIDLQQAIGRESDTGLTLLPLVLNEQLARADEILSSQPFRSLIDQLRQRYDFIIMDLPPIAPVVDVLAAVQVIDSLVFAVEWGSTKINAVQQHLMAEPELYDRLLGVVLNKANLKVLERFGQHGLSQNGYYTNHTYRQSARTK